MGSWNLPEPGTYPADAQYIQDGWVDGWMQEWGINGWMGAWVGVDVEIEGWTEEGTDFRKQETSLLF